MKAKPFNIIIDPNFNHSFMIKHCKDPNLFVPLHYHHNFEIMAILHGEGTRFVGDKIEASKSNWIKSFDGKSLGRPPLEQWAVKKDGGIFDQFAGATITPRAVVKTVKGGLEFYAEHRKEILGEKS